MPNAGNVKRRNGSKHDKTGCLTCRRRHKKCLENTFPNCGTCIRLNLVCVREPLRRIVQPKSTDVEQREKAILPVVDETSVVALAGPLDNSIQFSPWGSQSQKSRLFMRYYVDVLAKLLTTSHVHNSFLSEFVPMAMESDALFKSLVTFASSHLSCFQDQYQVATIENRSNALRALSLALSSGSNEIHECETNLASSLVLMTSDVILGNRQGWYDHLAGAKHIILSAQTSTHSGEVIRGVDALKQSTEGRWLLRNFAYHDIMSSVASRERLLLEADYLSGITDTVDTYFGLATDIMILIAKISALETLGYELLDNSPEGDDTTKATIVEIETALNEWVCPESSDTALVDMAYAYRSAALLYLYHKIRAPSDSATHFLGIYGDLTDKVQREVNRTLLYVSKIPWNGSPETSLVFPFFMAGVTTTCMTQIEEIRMRMNSIIEMRGFQNATRAREVLEKVWALLELEPKQYCGGLYWQDIVEIDGGGLLLS